MYYYTVHWADTVAMLGFKGRSWLYLSPITKQTKDNIIELHYLQVEWTVTAARKFCLSFVALFRLINDYQPSKETYQDKRSLYPYFRILIDIL